MSTGLQMDALLTGARAVIAAATPDVEPALTLREAPMNAHLAALQFGSAWEGTRRFHVTPGILQDEGGPRFGAFNGPLVHLKDNLIVEVRYHIPLRDGGYGRLADMIGTDAQIITRDLALNVLPWAGSDPSTIDPISYRVLPVSSDSTPELADAWIMRIVFETQTFLGE